MCPRQKAPAARFGAEHVRESRSEGEGEHARSQSDLSVQENSVMKMKKQKPLNEGRKLVGVHGLEPRILRL